MNDLVINFSRIRQQSHNDKPILSFFAGVRGGGPDPVQPVRLPRDLRAHGHRALPHRAQPASFVADAANEEVVFPIIFVPLSISPDGCTFPEQKS